MKSDKPNDNQNEKVAVSVTIPKDLLAEADDRATRLDLTRSQYFRQLVRRDIQGGEPQPVKEAA